MTKNHYFYGLNHFMQIIKKYFGELSSLKLDQLEALKPFYEDWNSKINLVSRKDMEHFYEHHVLHSLAIARYLKFVSGTKILDVGTGGGFPGIPLAIVFPEASFLLIDSIGKKIMVVNAAAEHLGLSNVTAEKQRAEEIKEQFDFVVSRAVTNLPEFISWTGNKFHGKSKNSKPNGILYLKGGDLKPELDALPRRWIKSVHPISQWFSEPYFETKSLIHLF